MSLPILTTVSDIEAICSYLATKPIGADITEAKSVIGSKPLDPRKINALETWGLIERKEGRMKITEEGRLAVKSDHDQKTKALTNIIRRIPPYNAIIEKAFHQQERTITANEIASHWHNNYKDQASPKEKTLNYQVLCFCHIAEGAGLGKITLGRKGKQTRFDFNHEVVGSFISSFEAEPQNAPHTEQPVKTNDSIQTEDVQPEPAKTNHTEKTQNNRIFMAHGKDTEILEFVKELLTNLGFEPVVSEEHETTAEPVPKKIMDEMRKCRGAVIHISPEQETEGGNNKINNNVLIEVGVAMALYGERFILLVQEGIELPSNLQGLYECRYQGDELNSRAMMKLLKAFAKFR